jgi:hypothetical protein
MAIEVLPLIASSDYDDFRMVVGSDMPDTYDRWCQLVTNQIRIFAQAGRTTKQVPIRPTPFVSFLSAKAAVADFMMLRTYAIEIDGRDGIEQQVGVV